MHCLFCASFGDSESSYDKFTIYCKLELSLEEKSLIDKFPELWDDELFTHEYFNGHTLEKLVEGVVVKIEEYYDFSISGYIEELVSVEGKFKKGCDELKVTLRDIDMFTTNNGESVIEI